MGKMQKILKDEITPEKLYFSRRKFMKLAAMFGTAYALAACGVPTPGSVTPSPSPEVPPDTLNTYDDITHFNNYYEFSPDKEAVADLAANFKTSPWPIEISGLVDKPQTIDVSEIISRYPAEERIYRLRCVEGWSLVIPWNGFPLSKLLDDIGVQKSAKYVKFTTIMDQADMPGQKMWLSPWPYVEGLRLDEARNELAILATGLYGKPLPNQDGAPIRLVVPWKYGFKSIKAIVKIELVSDQPVSYWTTSAPDEYGFYANVNPNVPHPRWSQETERRIGESGRRPTLMFNGYGDQVAYLYEGMDLKNNY
jgi:sulfoxide reductase catalytic subunit YedY